MANEQNLIPAKKGEVRNPKGRGKGNKDRATIAKKWLTVKTDVTNPITGEKEPGTLEDQLMLSLIKEGLKSTGSSKVSAIREAFEMLYGKAVQSIDVNNITAEKAETAKLFPFAPPSE